MTLEKAIKHYEEKAECYERQIRDEVWEPDSISEHNCIKNAEECRQLVEWLKELKRDREILNALSIYFQSLVVDAVINQRPLMFNMRDATEEERESVKQYIADSAKTTGVSFWNIIEEVNADEDSN